MTYKQELKESCIQYNKIKLIRTALYEYYDYLLNNNENHNNDNNIIAIKNYIIYTEKKYNNVFNKFLQLTNSRIHF